MEIIESLPIPQIQIDKLYKQAKTRQYKEKESLEYKNRSQKKDFIEKKLVSRVLSFLPKEHRILDLPCGSGRFTSFFTHNGYHVTSADASEEMLNLTRSNISKESFQIPIEKQNIFHTSYSNQQFDTVFCFRLLHHFSNPCLQFSLINELSRISSKYIVISYFSPWSFTSVKRSIDKFFGKKVRKHAIRLSTLQEYFASSEFHLIKDFAQFSYLHTLHLAIFERCAK
ncbi:MAG: class I SAM-dependent methyltransferase [Planctomycetota bacterium]